LAPPRAGAATPRLEPTWPWLIAKWAVLTTTAALVAALWIRPADGLRLLWYVLIPILPATFLVNVELWRNVCPVATLNMIADGAVGRRTMTRRQLRIATTVGIALLLILVPARRLVFNREGPALGVAILAVGALALLGGLVFDRKAGFCNSICPVLPIERLYGQRPLASVPNVRCARCDACTRTGCLDLAPERSGLVSLGDATTGRWTTSPFGAFALAFPGFVVGYAVLPDLTVAEAASAYGTVALWAAGSWVALATVVAVARLPARTALVLCGGLAAALYYWLSAPSIADQLGWPAGAMWGLRATALVLVALWLRRSRRASSRSATPRPSSLP